MSGDAAVQILKYAEAGEFDLIVMSAQGSSCTMGRSLGGTVDKVLKGVGTPLIILRTKEPPGQPSVFSRIVVPLDCSETSTAVLPHVERVARVLPSEVFLVRVVEPGIRVRTIGGLQYVPFREQDRDLARAAASECLMTEASRFAPVRGKVTWEVRAGNAAQEILALADEKGATLIAMSSHGHSKVRTWTMGSVVSRVVQAGTQSVWLVPTLARE
jgi:nucleotide-binding universal stress UspA family protein